MRMSLDLLFRGIQHALSFSGYVDICLKAKQIQLLEALLLKKDAVGVLPTGYGKSVIFHILPFFFDYFKRTDNSIVIVVSPLDSLIEDQVHNLQQRGVKAEILKTSRFSELIKEDDDSDTNDTELYKCEVAKNCNLGEIQRGNIRILFTHPEGFISCKKGRTILLSKLFQERVVSCVIDEAHLVTDWGSDFRQDFAKVSQLGSLFPHVPMLALTATAPPKKVKELVQALRLHNPFICVGNLDRPNLFIEKHQRKPNCKGTESYERLHFIAEELKGQLTSYPLTIVYLPLKWCGYAFKYFLSVLGEKSYVDGYKQPQNCLFAQFHASQTDAMKSEILKQICHKSENSNIRIVFATVAIGLGVNLPALRQVIHIGAPRTLEAYYQEIGRAGRDGKPAKASLYFNNSDIASNVPGMTKEMRNYCLDEEACLRKTLITYLGSAIGFTGVPHLCCSNCAKSCNCDTCVLISSMEKSESKHQDLSQREKVRVLTTFERDEISQSLKLFRLSMGSSRKRSSSIDVATGFTLGLIESIVIDCEYIKSVEQLCRDYPIWDPLHAEFIMDVLSKY